MTYKENVKGISYAGTMPTALLNLFLNISEMGRKVKDEWKHVQAKRDR